MEPQRLKLTVVLLVLACCETLVDSDTLRGSRIPNGTYSSTRNEQAGNGNETADIISTFQIVTFKWEHVMEPYLVALWILVAWLCKLVIELDHRVTQYIPESALLITCGFIFGGIIWGADKAPTFYLLPRTFFFYILPQIILETGYHMPNKLFFGNMGAILLFAVVGTCWAAGTIGLALWGCYLGGAMGALDITLLDFLLFGSLLSAVDPVAVIAVFEQVHVNEVLYIIVFGESLLNDGVTVVLYNVFDTFVKMGAENIQAADIIKGIVSFFVVACGGTIIGVCFGILISLLTRITKNVQIIEPGYVFIMGYLAYLTAEMLSLSAILSITFYGVFCQKYVMANMDESSVNTVRYAMKAFANGSETILFFFLGVSAIDTHIWKWNTGFILLTILFMLVFRYIGVFVMTWMLNQFRLIPLSIIDQVVMGYGGLRGGVVYGLAFLLDDAKVKEKNLFISTTLIVVYFTVMLQGVLIKPLVTWLRVKRSQPKDPLLVEKLQSRLFDHILVGIEDISGQFGNNYFKEKWTQFDEKWLCWLLIKPSVRKSRDYLFSVYHHLNVQDAVSYVSEGEHQGSLAFLRSESDANVDFNKNLSSKVSEIISKMTPEDASVSSFLRDNISSVCLDMQALDLWQKTGRQREDMDTHHIIQQHLYKSRKQPRNRFSRSNSVPNKDENEVQEIFQRTMKRRLESFKSAKMGVGQSKKIQKHQRKDHMQKHRNCVVQMQMRTPPVESPNLSFSFQEEDFDFPNVDVTQQPGGGIHFLASGTLRTVQEENESGGIENPAFIPDEDQLTSLRPPPWVPREDTVVPSQSARLHLPWSPNTFSRLTPLRLSARSTDSFQMADAPTNSEHPHSFLPNGKKH
uniref:Sodium/hydrogen exchanger n=1 Tax=Lepisosteus oculatus TaxID=7918 RepID=W5MMV8_LEPOC